MTSLKIRDFFGDSSLKLHISVKGLSSRLHSLVNSKTFLLQYENKFLIMLHNELECFQPTNYFLWSIGKDTNVSYL